MLQPVKETESKQCEQLRGLQKLRVGLFQLFRRFQCIIYSGTSTPNTE